jgi:hypothetical protein
MVHAPPLKLRRHAVVYGSYSSQVGLLTIRIINYIINFIRPFNKTHFYMETAAENYLSSIKKQFHYYKSVGDKAIERVNEEQLHWSYNGDSNSIAIIIKHIAGNSISRWTDFLTSDGEKSSRNRDNEFEDTAESKEELFALWNKGWDCLFNAIAPLKPGDLLRTIYIRNEAHTVMEAINRQFAHIPYHIGQIVYIAKMVSGDTWQSLTIPKGKSNEFNAEKQRKSS